MRRIRLTENKQHSILEAMGKELMLGRRNQVTLPREFVQDGPTLFECVRREDGVIELIPQISIPAHQAYFWTKRWQEGEGRASRDVRENRLRRHRSAEALLRRLDRKRKA